MSVNEAPLPEGFHAYVAPPETEMVVDSPLQIDEGEALAEIDGKGFTETVTLAVPVHPAADVPVTL